MAIDYDRFVEWAESRFDHVVVSGAEVKLNSIFCEDRKHHLWCNPSGGKNSCETGVYHCWKSGNKGSLVGLVMTVDGCCYEDALKTLDIAPSKGLAELEQRVEQMFQSKQQSVEEEKAPFKGLQMPPNCYSFDELPSSHRLKSIAESYLKSRRIPTEGLFICTAGRYKNRILIPYLDRSGVLVYYNGRIVGSFQSDLRYLGPPKELGIGKGDVLYSRKWPVRGDKVYITEGEFDSMSLDLCGFRSVALGGKSITEAQIKMISGCVPVLSLDADDAGAEAMPRMASALMRAGFDRVRYVRPSKEYKDWNGLMSSRGEEVVRLYIQKQEREYQTVAGGDWEGTRMGINGLVR
jgi:DNA primase